MTQKKGRKAGARRPASGRETKEAAAALVEMRKLQDRAVAKPAKGRRRVHVLGFI